MANLSNINGKFVVEQTTGFVGIGTTDPGFLIEASGTNAELALNASSIYRVRSTSNDEFIITKNGVGDRLTIAGGGDATFSNNVISLDTFYLQNGSGKRWQQLFDGDNWNLRYYNGSSWSADALAIDTSNNATFAGNVQVTGAFKDSSGDTGTSGQVLSSTATGTNWIDNDTGDVSGSGVNNRLAIWSGTKTIDSDSDFYVDGDTIFTTNLEASGTGTFTGAVVGASFSAAGGFLNGSNGGIRIHSSGTKFFNITAANAARDNIMDIGASDARFKDLYLGGNIQAAGNVGIGETNPDFKLNVTKGYTSGFAKVAKFRSGNDATFVNFDTVQVVQTDVPCLAIIETPSGTQSDEQKLTFAVGDNKAIIGSTSTVTNGVSFYTNRAVTTTGFTASGNLALHLGSNGYVGMGITNTNNQRLTLAEADSNGSHIKMNNSRSGGGYFVMGVGDTNSTSSIVPAGGLFFYNGTTRMVINSSGNVGIGSTNPEKKLHILTSTTDDTPQVLIQNGSSGDASLTFNVSGQSYVVGIDQDDSSKFKIAASGALGTNDRVTLLSSGNVGIGTITPSGKLNVEASGNHLHLRANTATAGKYWNFDITSANQLYIINNGGTGMTILDNGSVGIGVYTPSESLEISGNMAIRDTHKIYFNHNTNTNRYIGASSTNDLEIVADDDINYRSNYHRFFNGSTEFARLSSSTNSWIANGSNGKLGINKTNPSYNLDVTGTIHASGSYVRTSTSSDVWYSNSNTATYTQTVLYMNQSNSSNNDANGYFFERGRISNSATAEIRRWVIGARGGQKQMVLDGPGTLTVAGDVVAYGSPSDKRLKENIKPIESALDKVSKLQGVTFDWKESDSILNIKQDIGFIAQDVQKVVPELVRENEDGMLSMRHQGIAPILLEAIKELKAEIEKLKKHSCDCKK